MKRKMSRHLLSMLFSLCFFLLIPAYVYADGWVAISAGYQHTIALKSDGTLWAWGSNGYGQLGDDTTTERLFPTQIGTDMTWVTVSAGNNHTIALKSDGTLWAWGLNDNGQLGDVTATQRTSPTKIGTDTNWVAVSAGGAHTIAIKSDGTLWGWGNNSNGQLGLGYATTSYPYAITPPTKIGTDTNWVAVSAGEAHTIALKSDGTLWGWGNNNNGQLGLGYTTPSYPYAITSPTKIGTDTNWVTVSAGYAYTIALKSDGTLWAWGWNSYGRLGDGTSEQRISPTKIGTDMNWVAVSAGYSYTMALKSDGTLWAWGKNDYGELGLGYKYTFFPYGITSPTKIGTDTNWVAVSAGNWITVALKSDGTRWAWGGNYYGESGDGTKYSISVPKQIGSSIFSADFHKITTGSFHTMALKSDGTLWGWGNNGYGQVGIGYTTSSTSPPYGITSPTQIGTDKKWVAVSAGYLHTIGLRSDGTLWGWGANDYGQLGMGYTTPSTSPPYGIISPTQIGTDTKWVAVSTGNYHTIALKADGTLWAWGVNDTGQLGDNTTTQRNSPTQIGADTKWVAVSAGASHTIALKSDGTLWGWGFNGTGALGLGYTSINPPYGITSPTQIGTDMTWVAISACYHTIGLKSDGTLWAWGTNVNGQLGDGTTTQRTSPYKIGADTKWVAVSAGESYTMALKSDGTLWAWGYDYYGQLGNGTTPELHSPGQIGSDTKWIAVSAGYGHTVALKSDGTLWAWGRNNYGQLGDGTRTDQIIPAQLDTAGPTGSITINGSLGSNSGYTISQSVTLTLSAYDTNGVSQMRFNNDNITWSDPQAYTTTPTPWTLPYGDGVRNVYVMFMDTRWNWSSPLSATITLDTTPPAKVIISGTPPVLTNSTSATLTVGGADVVAYKYKVNSGAYSSEYPVGTPINLTSLEHGSYTVSVKGRDTAGNWQADGSAATATWMVDITPPTGTVSINNGALGTNSKTVTLYFGPSDVGSQVVQMCLRNENQTSCEWEAVASSKTWTLSDGTGVKTVYVKFRDAAGNESTTNSSPPITFDTNAPVLTITSPDSGASVTSLQAIGGTASDVTPSSGLNRVELQITDGAGNYLTADGTWTTTAAFFNASGGTPANWSHTFLSSPWSIGTTYTITTRVFDNAGNSSQEVTSTFTFIAAKKAYTELTVTPSSVSILQNGKVDVTGMLSVPGAPEENLSNKEIILKITYKPDQGEPVVKAEISANTNDDTSGHYLSTGIEKDGQDFIFSQKGTYTIQASFAGSPSLMSKTAETFVVVGQVAGYAILVQGRIEADSEGLASHNKTTNRIYNVLKTQRGFIDSNIYYFNYTMPQDGVVVDEVPTQAGIQWAIETWAYGMLVSNPAPLYIIMVDHGTNGDFYIGNKTITPTNLADWLDNLEGTLKRVGGAQALAALAERRIVIIGACYSGSFITQRLSKPATPGAPDRLIVTSAAANEESYKGPDELDTVRSGEYFMEEFFIKLGRGYTFRNSFEEAARKTREYTRKGGTSANSANKYFDDAVQHPLLEDNGDWTGSNTLSDVQGKGDGHVVKNLLLGVGPTYDTNSAENPAEIVSVTETRYLNPSETSATLELWANRPKVEIDPAWVEVRTPAKELIGTGGKSQLALGLRKFFMSSVDETTKRWATIPPVADANEGIFTESGKYEALYFVSDKATGKISPMKRSVIYKKMSESDNPPPATFSLIEPGNDSTPKTVVVFRWEASSDPDGVTYNLVIAKDSDFKNVVYRREEIPVPVTYVDNTILVKDATPENPTGMRLGLKDDTDYYWRIEAVDGYGAITVSTDSSGNPQVWHFHTDNTNGYPGILTGIIYTDQTFAQITSAAIQATVSSALLADAASTAGQFAMAVPYQGEVTLAVSAPGYYPATVSGVSVQPGETTKVYVPMTQKLSGDINRDGVISVADLILILKICARLPIPPEAEVHVEAAINNRIGLAEAIYILQTLAEIR